MRFNIYELQSNRAAAASLARSDWVSAVGLFGLTSNAIPAAPGTNSRNSPSRFATNDFAEVAHAGDVAARPVEARDKAQFDRVGAGTRTTTGIVCGRRLGRQCCGVCPQLR